MLVSHVVMFCEAVRNPKSKFRGMLTSTKGQQTESSGNDAIYLQSHVNSFTLEKSDENLKT